MHRVKSEHGKDDEDDDITDDERKIEQHTAAMQTGSYHRGKFGISYWYFKCWLFCYLYTYIYYINKFSGHPHHLQHPPYHHHHHHHTMLSAWR